MNGRRDNPRSPFRGYFHQLKELKLRYPHLKILISLEGAQEASGKARSRKTDALSSPLV